jgi:hypothetical protein
MAHYHLNDPLRGCLPPVDTSTYISRQQLLEVRSTWPAIRIGGYAGRPTRYQVCALSRIFRMALIDQRRNCHSRTSRSDRYSRGITQYGDATLNRGRHVDTSWDLLHQPWWCTKHVECTSVFLRRDGMDYPLACWIYHLL